MKGSTSLQFAIPTTLLSEPGLVRLVAGEDFRFTLRGSELESWLPAVLERLDGRSTLDDLLHSLAPERRAEALALLERLVSERLLFAAESLPMSFDAVVEAEGRGELFDCVQSLKPAARAARRVRTLCQDTLDYHAAREFNRACRSGSEPWLWATLGPSARAFVSPVFWPDVGPCVACLLDGFERLSPAPELYGALVRHAEQGGKLASAQFPERALAMLGSLVHAKVAMLSEPEPPAAVSRLHVLELATLEIAAHRIPRDLECGVCYGDVEALGR